MSSAVNYYRWFVESKQFHIVQSLGNLFGVVGSYRFDGWYSIPAGSVGNILFSSPRAQRLSSSLTYLPSRQVGRTFLGNEHH
jgi:hypothetical protein